ncbi:protein of unknown function DUF86 [[Leptolyngbya] sp. PCC 7376]|uniref:HepT-like ribonuclease domain-containing protein n=1 Tax=[Leptolyngbya] sp. PCC 7376 TaxID=111781 RepID=UPI00029EC798|nr:HepT-like ribonuclease domain-containing protein [[Leptolyngbya] sp. PCC 7376]AFY36880.1 protein of unknown function DUF86 [[Leptolyngbya] sp. PCC 7376]
MNRDQEILLDAIEACNLILQFSQGYNYTNFEEDKKTQSSVLYQIAILGETTNRFSTKFIAENPQIPFHAIRGMRNRVIHEYKEVDSSILWEVIRIDIPNLLSSLQRIKF